MAEPHTIAIPTDTLGQRGDTAVSAARPNRLVRIARWAFAASTEQKFLAVLLLLFLVKGVIVAFVHPPFTGHDEVAHYAYLEYLVEERRPPLIPDLDEWRATYDGSARGDHDRIPDYLWKYCAYATADWGPGCRDTQFANTPVYVMNFGSEASPYPTGWIYSANHPPLFYLLLVPAFLATESMSPESQLYIFRLLAIPMGMLVVLLAFLTVRTIFPRDRFLALMVPAFVAFQPQISYEAAMLNNDILAILFTSAVIFLVVRGLRDGFPLRTCALIGLCFGLAMLAKNTAATSAALIAFAMIVGLGLRNWRAWLPKGVLVAAIAGLLIAPWYVYMMSTYGDLTAFGRIRELQYWNYSRGPAPSIPDMLTDRGFVWSRWHETWGQFGWRLIPISRDFARLLLWVTMIGTVGVALWAIRFHLAQRTIRRADAPAAARARTESILDLQRWQVVAILTLGATCLLSYYAILQFGTTFSLTQARYYFTAIVPAAILLMLGFRALTPKRWLPYAQTSLFLALVAMTIVIYSAYVIPYWSSAGRALSEIDLFYR